MSRYKNWESVIEKLQKDINHAKETLIDVKIALELQEYLLKYAKKRIMDEEKPEEKEEDKSSEEDQSKE